MGEEKSTNCSEVLAASKLPSKGADYEPRHPFKPKHFKWEFADGIATVTLNRPERKNPLTFESYAELRDIFRDALYADASRPWSLPAPAAISARAATCTRSSAR